jgi:hypothetical protein
LAKSKKKWLVFGIAWIIVVAAILALRVSNPAAFTPTPTNPNKPAAAATSTPLPALLTPAENLAVGKKYKPATASIVQVNEAVVALKDVPESAPEFKEAQALLKIYRERSVQLTKERELAASAAIPAGSVIGSDSPEFAKLQVVSSNWEKSGFGAVVVWKVKFKNTSARPIGNIKYRTSYTAETGDVVDRGGTDSLMSKDTLQKVIKPGETRTLEINDGFVNQEAHQASFAVVSWEYLNQ